MLRGLLRRSRALPVPFSEEYAADHQRLVTKALHSRDLLSRFGEGRPLPVGHGVGLDERVVEYPWLLAQHPSGDVLDAGSALNHAHILDAFLPLAASLTIVTLAPEEIAFPERGVTYTYADLRKLPFSDATFDTIASVSTLEHVGMDNSRFGAAPTRAQDPHAALVDAVRELKRVLRPGGVALATVPYGLGEDFGWFRQFDQPAVAELVAALGARTLSVTVFRYSARGWQMSSLEDAAEARYHDASVDKTRPADLAVAARSVACIRATI